MSSSLRARETTTANVAPRSSEAGEQARQASRRGGARGACTTRQRRTKLSTTTVNQRGAPSPERRGATRTRARYTNLRNARRLARQPRAATRVSRTTTTTASSDDFSSAALCKRCCRGDDGQRGCCGEVRARARWVLWAPRSNMLNVAWCMCVCGRANTGGRCGRRQAAARLNSAFSFA